MRGSLDWHELERDEGNWICEIREGRRGVEVDPHVVSQEKEAD